MRKMKRIGGKKENLVYLLLWIVLFVMPVFSMVIHNRQEGMAIFDWAEIFAVWKVNVVFLAIFLFHNFILAPLLVYRRRSWLYFSATACLVFLFIMWRCVTRPPMPRHHDNRPPRTEQMRQAPDAGSSDFRSEERFRKQHGPRRSDDPHRTRPPVIFGQEDVMSGLFIVLLLGMNLGVKLYFKSEEDRREFAELKHHSLEHQLEYLRYQINPHFLMNTLNNIHALVDIDPERSKTTIVELSKLMRYVLYEGAKDVVPLSREVDFVQNYITLMRLRYTDKVSIDVSLPESLPDRNIPPLLFISFVENAFKHGVSYSSRSFIRVTLHCTADDLTFTCRNSKHPDHANEQGGVGLENVRRRLDLLYGDDYRLDIAETGEEYGVTLVLPLKTETADDKS